MEIEWIEEDSDSEENNARDEFLGNLDFNPKTGRYYDSLSGRYYDHDGDEILVSDPRAWTKTMIRKGRLGTETADALRDAPDNNWGDERRRSWIQKNWDFSWDALTNWHWKLLLNKDRNYRERFSLFLFFYRNGVSPSQSYRWCVGTTLVPSTSVLNHYMSLVNEVEQKPHKWDTVPVYDIISGRVDPPSSGSYSSKAQSFATTTTAEKRGVNDEEEEMLRQIEDDYSMRQMELAQKRRMDFESAALDKIEQDYKKRKLQRENVQRDLLPAFNTYVSPAAYAAENERATIARKRMESEARRREKVERDYDEYLAIKGWIDEYQ